MRIIVISFLLVVNGFFLQAQTTDTTQYHLRYSISGMVNKTNEGRSFVLNNGLSFDIKKRKVLLNSSSSWIYGRQKEGLLNNDFNTGMNFDLLKDVQHFYYWGLASFTSSYSLNIRYQFQTGAGVGYTFIQSDNAELGISDGILYEAAAIQTPEDMREVYNTVRNSLRLKYSWKLSNLLSLDGTHFWQPSLKNVDDYIIRSATSLSIALKSWLHLNTNLVYNKISRTNRENFMINIGMVAERSF